MNPLARLLLFLVLCTFLWEGQPSVGTGLAEPISGLLRSSSAATVPTPSLELVGHIGGPALQVALQGAYAYVASGFELAVLNVSDPTHPTRIGYWMYPSAVSHVREMVVDNGFAYLASEYTGLQILDVSDSCPSALCSPIFK